MRADRDRRPRPDPRDRHAGRAQAARPARVDLPARARPASTRASPPSSRLPGVVSAAPAADADPEMQRVAVNLVLVGGRGAGRRRHGARRPRQPHPRPAQVRAHARGRVRRARGPRLRRRGDDGRRRWPDRVAAGDDGATASRTCRRRRAPTRPTRPTRWRPADDRGRPAGRRPASIFASSRNGTDPRTASIWTRRQVVENNARAARRPRLPARPGHGPRAVVGVLRDPAAVPHDVGVRARLPHPPGARGLRRLRRPRRRDGGVLAQRRLDDGGPAVLGEGPGQPRALLRGADEPDVGAAGHGRRRADHEHARGPSRSSWSRRSCSA